MPIPAGLKTKKPPFGGFFVIPHERFARLDDLFSSFLVAFLLAVAAYTSPDNCQLPIEK